MTTAEAAELARRRLGWPPSAGPRIETFVAKAIQRLTEKLGSHPTKRRYVFSDPATTQATLDGSGSADLSSLSDAGLLLEQLAHGEITDPAYPNMPLVPQGSTGEGALLGNFDSQFAHFWMVGSRIFTKGDGAPLAGPLSFACPQVKPIGALPIQIHDELIDEIVLVASPAPANSAT